MTDSRESLLVEIPWEALQLVIQGLNSKSRKNLALTCTHLWHNVRRLWQTVVVNVMSNEPVPRGLLHFSSLRFMLWTDQSENIFHESNDRLEECSPWDNGWVIPHCASHANAWPYPMGAIAVEKLIRLTAVNELVYQALNPPHSDPERGLRKVILVFIMGRGKFFLKAADVQKLLIQTLPPSFLVRAPAHLIRKADPLTLDVMKRLARVAAVTIQTAMQEHGADFGAGPTAHTLCHSGYLGDVYRSLLASDRMRIMTIARRLTCGSFPDMSCSFVEPKFRLMERIRMYLSQLCFEDAGADVFAYIERLGFGHLVPDGALGDLVRNCMVDLCTGTPPHNTHCMQAHVSNVQFEKYTAMTSLHLTFNDCGNSGQSHAVVNGSIVPKLSSMKSLEELYLCKPSWDIEGSGIHLHMNLLNPPALTKLDLNEMIVFESFEEFTHMTALQSLSVNLDLYDYDPGDVTTLTALKSLRSLTVTSWDVQECQDISVLTQLTELNLVDIRGDPLKAKPSCDMGGVLEVTFTQLPSGENMSYKRDSKFAIWALEHAVFIFPRAEVLHLGTLGAAPLNFDSVGQLRAAASSVDRKVTPLLSHSQCLMYFQLDCVFNITNENLDMRCDTGSLTLESSLEVERGGLDASGPRGVDTGAKKWCRQHWDRSVEFVSCRFSEILVAEFHYSLRAAEH